jgi:predicted acyl esterase
MRTLKDEWITASDGVRICADVYLPDGDGPFPSLHGPMAAYKYPRVVTLTGALPKGPTGRILMTEAAAEQSATVRCSPTATRVRGTKRGRRASRASPRACRSTTRRLGLRGEG